MDYGVGGMDLFRRIKRERLEVGITYFSDSGAIPYGKLSRKELYDRVQQVIEFLKNNGADLVAVACHAASTVSMLKKDPAVLDMINCTKSVTTNAHIQHIGIIGGGRTIRSGIYAKYFRGNGVKVSQRIAQPLSILIESGEVESARVDDEIGKILSPIRNVDALLLACTHYPVLTDRIRDFLGSKCEVIDPLEKLLENIHPRIQDFDAGEDIFYTTGDASLMTSVARSIYDIRIDKPKQLLAETLVEVLR